MGEANEKRKVLELAQSRCLREVQAWVSLLLGDTSGVGANARRAFVRAGLTQAQDARNTVLGITIGTVMARQSVVSVLSPASQCCC